MPIDFPNTPTPGQVYTYGSRTWTWTGYGWQATTTTLGPQGLQGLQGVQGTSSAVSEIQLLDSLSNQFDGSETRFLLTYNGDPVTVSNSLRLLVSLNGIVQIVKNSFVTWDNPLAPTNGIRVDDDGYLVFLTPPAAGALFEGRVLVGPTTTTLTTTYPFAATDLLMGAF
jgi:hypothetical protein